MKMNYFSRPSNLRSGGVQTVAVNSNKAVNMLKGYIDSI